MTTHRVTRYSYRNTTFLSHPARHVAEYTRSLELRLIPVLTSVYSENVETQPPTRDIHHAGLPCRYSRACGRVPPLRDTHNQSCYTKLKEIQTYDN